MPLLRAQPGRPTRRSPLLCPRASTVAPPRLTHAIKLPARQARKARTVTSLTYVVKPGDNLTIIAAWFHLHGYGALHDRNKAAIGAEPNLIHPGLRITISDRGMTTSS
jgi:hypothetical protein